MAAWPFLEPVLAKVGVGMWLTDLPVTLCFRHFSGDETPLQEIARSIDERPAKEINKSPHFRLHETVRRIDRKYTLRVI